MDQTRIKNMLATLHNGGALPTDLQVSSVTNGKGALYNAAPSGFEQPISTLTRIKEKVIEQKFYEINPAESVPIKVGEGAFTEDSLYYLNFKISGDFASGIMDQGNGTRKDRADVAYDAVRLPNHFWGKEMDYSLIEVNQAAVNAGNAAVNLISQKESALKTNWDLGMQDTAIIGQPSINANGLLT